MTRLLGDCFGVEITKRTKKRDGVSSPLITLLTEDDGHWHAGTVLDALWLDDLIAVLTAAKQTLRGK